jgi:hypothetical protein
MFPGVVPASEDTGKVKLFLLISKGQQIDQVLFRLIEKLKIVATKLQLFHFKGLVIMENTYE